MRKLAAHVLIGAFVTGMLSLSVVYSASLGPPEVLFTRAIPGLYYRYVTTLGKAPIWSPWKETFSGAESLKYWYAGGCPIKTYDINWGYTNDELYQIQAINVQGHHCYPALGPSLATNLNFTADTVLKITKVEDHHTPASRKIYISCYPLMK